MIVAGLMTIVQSMGIKHPKLGFQWGAGTLSVMGISFTTMPIAQAVVPQLKREYATMNNCALKFGACGLRPAMRLPAGGAEYKLQSFMRKKKRRERGGNGRSRAACIGQQHGSNYCCCWATLKKHP